MKQVLKSKEIKQNFITILILLIIFLIILNPAKYIASTSKGIMVWATIVLPSLLPFFFLSKMLLNFKCVYTFSNSFSKITKNFYNCPSISSYIFLMSAISGYPVGAKLISEFYNIKAIDTGEAHRLVSFCSTSGPMFIVGSIGVGLFSNKVGGLIILFAHLFSALLNGLLYRKIKLSNNYSKKTPVFCTDNIISESMHNTIISVLMVGGFIAVSFTIIDILNSCNIFAPIESFLNFIFSPLCNNIGPCISNGILEVTNGCIKLSNLNLSPKVYLPILSGLISFGGLCIHLQSISFLQTCKINYKFFLLTKTTHAIISVIIAWALCLFI